MKKYNNINGITPKAGKAAFFRKNPCKNFRRNSRQIFTTFPYLYILLLLLVVVVMVVIALILQGKTITRKNKITGSGVIMEVISFKDLKPTRKAEKDVCATTDGGVVRNGQPAVVKTNAAETPAPTSRVLSFAHLKPRGRADRPASSARQPEPVKEEKPHVPALSLPGEASPSPPRTFFRIPAVADTAFLASVNHCAGCDRYLPPGDAEPDIGRCRFDDCMALD